MSARTSNPTVERFRELGFVSLALVGALLFALGVGFLVIGVSIGTGPPAPYTTPTGKRLLIIASLAAIVGGVLVVRMAGKVVGW